MELNQESLKILIRNIIIKLFKEFKKTNEDLFIILNNCWKNQYDVLLKELENHNQFTVNIVIDSSMENEFYFNKIKSYKNSGLIIKREEINMESLNIYKTVFPYVPREIIVKTALGIDDTFETKWIKNCFSKGQQILFLSSGMEGFTGKEPKKYIQTMQQYYRTILEYGIQIKNKLCFDDILNIEENISFNDSVVKNQVKQKKIITTSEIESYRENKKLVLKNNDIITSLANDRARELGIDIVRNQ